MATNVRLNRIIDRLEAGKPAFGPTGIPSGMFTELGTAADAGYDFVMVENEHMGMDFPDLRFGLQNMLSRSRIASKGNLQAHPTPLVRVSPNASEVERNQWVIKQTLDHGVYGIVLPRMETVEQAEAAVVASRYVQRSGAPDSEPVGERGWGPTLAARYWGLSAQEYYDKSDLWPLDPDGELILMPIIETPLGVKNLADILRKVKGVGAVFAGPGDLAIAMGLGAGRGDDPDLQAAVLKIVNTAQEFNVPCMCMVNSPEELEQRLEQGFRIFQLGGQVGGPLLAKAREMCPE